MAASTVTYANMLSESWNNIYQLITTAANVVDPTIGSVEVRKWVYTRDPDVKSSDFAGHPYIVVNPSLVDFSLGRRSVDPGGGQPRIVQWTVEIEVVTSDRGYGNRDGQGQTDNDGIVDDVVETLNNTTNRNTLRVNGLFDVDQVVTSVVVEPNHQTLVYRRSVLVTLKNRMKVSA